MLNHGMIAVKRVSAAAEVVIMSVRCQHVINVIVKSLKREKRSVFITLGRMIEYYVKYYFYAV